jgi:Outer membrane protein beta-barrel domain
MSDPILLLKRPVKNKRKGKKATCGIVGLIILLLPMGALAQADSLSNRKGVSDCEATLALATSEFNAGRFFSLPPILQKCLAKGFTKEQRVRAYILLCQVYLINDSPAEAEASYLKLLTADPEYIATPELDPIDVVYLSKKFTTRPVFTPHVRVGINASAISLIHNNSPPGKPVVTSFKLKPGWSFGGGLDWNLSDRVSLGIDATYTTRAFQKVETGIFDNDRTEQIFRLSWLDAPLYIKYQDYIGTWRPYGYFGYAMHVKLTSTGEFTFVNIESSGTSTPTEGLPVSLASQQHLVNRSIVLGGGMKYKLGKNYWFGDLRLQIGHSDIADESKIIDLPLASEFAYVSDSYRVNGLTLSIGYIIPVYNPRKKGTWEPKGFLGKILNVNKKTK